MMINKEKRRLTSVEIEDLQLFEDFKVQCIKDRFSLNKLVKFGMHLYLNDVDFRNRMRNSFLKNK